MNVEDVLLDLLSEAAFFSPENPDRYSKAINRSDSLYSKYFEELGYTRHIIERKNEVWGKYTSCIIYESGKNDIAFQGHLDVVPYTAEKWAEEDINPLGDKIGNKVYGRGASDCKGSSASLIISLYRTEDRPIVIITCDEEHGEITKFGGIVDALDFLTKNNLLPKFCISYDSTNLKLIVGRKGMLYCVLTAFGKSAHGSRPWEGDNAIYKMAKIVNTLEKFSHELSGIKHPQFTYGRTLNVGTIKGGDKVNRVPDKCQIEIESRLLPGEDGIAEVNRIKERIINEELIEGKDFVIELKTYFPSAVMSGENSYAKILKECMVNAGLDSEYRAEDGFGEMNIIGNTVDVVGLGAGHTEAEHSDPEWIEIEHLNLLTDVYTNFLNKVSNKKRRSIE